MKVIEVVAAIIKKGNKIFITRRSYGEFADMWGISRWKDGIRRN